MSCIFCKIIQGDIPAKKVFESESVIGFVDLHPLANKHFLFIHKNHTKDVNEMVGTDPNQVGEIFKSITAFTQKEKMDQEGFRVVTNLGSHAGQSVFHTHFHLLGGETLGRFGR